MAHTFPKSKKVNTDPAWSLKDYAIIRGLKLSDLKILRDKREDFPESTFSAKSANHPKGSNLYNLRELDAFMKKYKESKQ